MIRELIKLPYAYNPLEPMMSSETLQYHHDKHYSGYISNLFPELTTPSPALDSILCEQFGSVEAFKESFIEKGLALFGSGWVWLCIDDKENLSIVTTSNADNPIRSGLVPLMVCDVWEHAYYIDYRNARADYLEGFWKLLNWKFVSFNYANH